MENAVNIQSGIPTVSVSSVLDTARCLVELKAIDDAPLTRYLPNLHQLLKKGWNEGLVEARWPESDLIHLWQLVDTEHYPQVGLDVAINQEMKNYGVLAKWVSQCSNLKEAFTLFTQNIHLLNPSECWNICEAQGEYTITFSFSHKSNYPEVAIHRSMIALLIWGRALSGVSFKANEIAWPKVGEKLERLLSDFTNNITQSDIYKITLSKQVLELKLQSADPYLKNVLAKQVAQMQVSTSNRLVDKVIHLFHCDIHTYRNIKQVSHALNLSSSSLYRHLKQENTQFSSLLDNFRQIQYQSLSAQTSNAETLAEALGFGDVSSYLKAKKRWQKMNI